MPSRCSVFGGGHRVANRLIALYGGAPRNASPAPPGAAAAAAAAAGDPLAVGLFCHRSPPIHAKPHIRIRFRPSYFQLTRTHAPTMQLALTRRVGVAGARAARSAASPSRVVVAPRRSLIVSRAGALALGACPAIARPRIIIAALRTCTRARVAPLPVTRPPSLSDPLLGRRRRWRVAPAPPVARPPPRPAAEIGKVLAVWAAGRGRGRQCGRPRAAGMMGAEEGRGGEGEGARGGGKRRPAEKGGRFARRRCRRCPPPPRRLSHLARRAFASFLAGRDSSSVPFRAHPSLRRQKKTRRARRRPKKHTPAKKNTPANATTKNKKTEGAAAGPVNDTTFEDLVLKSDVPVLVDFWA